MLALPARGRPAVTRRALALVGVAALEAARERDPTGSLEIASFTPAALPVSEGAGELRAGWRVTVETAPVRTPAGVAAASVAGDALRTARAPRSCSSWARSARADGARAARVGRSRSTMPAWRGSSRR